MQFLFLDYPLSDEFEQFTGAPNDGSKFLRGEMGSAGSVFEGAFNINATRDEQSSNKYVNLFKGEFHDSHQNPDSFTEKLQNAFNIANSSFDTSDANYLKIEIEPARRDNTNTVTPGL